MAAALDQGYDDERFESVVSKNYHCIICFNVFKDPVMCRNNEHLFCRACITQHLRNSKTCPSCMEELSIDTLREAPRFVTSCLAELRIRCEYFNRGCGFIDLEKLEKHVTECGYAPVVCSNEGCELEVNKRDLIHHETAVCEQRRVKCHNCGEIREELNKVHAKLDNIEAAFCEKFAKLNGTLQNLDVKLNRLETLDTSVQALVQKVHNKGKNKTENAYKAKPKSSKAKNVDSYNAWPPKCYDDDVYDDIGLDISQFTFK